MRGGIALAGDVQALDAPHSASRRLVIRVATGCAAILVVAALGVAFAGVRLPTVPGFSWAYATLYLVTGIVTAVLLMQAPPGSWSQSLSLLASGYLFSALMTVPFLLSFPGAFTPDPVPLVGGSQSAVWSFYLWHAGFLACVLASSILARTSRKRPAPASNAGSMRRPPSQVAAVLWGILPAAVLAALVLAASSVLPDLIGPGLTSQKTTTIHVVSWSVVALGLVTLGFALAEARNRSQLRVWLVPVVLLSTFEALQLPVSGRYLVGWYAPRILGMVATTVLLVALLVQAGRQARALSAAQAESARLARIVEQSPAGYALLDAAHRIVEVNAAFCDLTGLSREHLVGAPCEVVFGADDSCPDIAALMGGETRTLSLRRRIVRGDGSQMWVDLTAQRMTDADGEQAGLAVSISDASGEVAADLDPSAPVGMAVMNADGMIIRATQALCVLLQQDRSVLVGSAFAELVAEDDRLAHASAVELMRRGELEAGGGEVRLLRDGSVPFWAAVYRSALRDARGGLVGFAVQVVDVDSRRQAEAEALEARIFLEHRSTYDDLTGLLNRATFVDRVQEALDGGSTMAVINIDIDRFRRVSNAMTRRDGDAVLVEAVRRLVATADTDALIARVGGDEFALAVRVQGRLAADQAMDWAGRSRDAISQEPIGRPGRDVRLTCTVGVTVAQPGDLAADRIQEADLATREAKDSGQGLCRLYDQRMREDLLGRLEMTERIRGALAGREFTAWYQPVVSLSDGRLIGYEALSRWVRPDGTVTPPDDYLPAAEDSGLIVSIGEAALDAAVARLARLPEPLVMAVNASPTELLSSDFAGRVGVALARHDVAPGRLVVEITEQAMFDVGRAEDAGLTRLADLGVSLHVDDFGTGYSSITHLRDFPIRGIKLDRSFTAQLDGDGARAAEIASTLADLAARLRLDSVAEGIETPEQARRLAAMGWRAGQGWAFGRPQPETSASVAAHAGAPVRARRGGGARRHHHGAHAEATALALTDAWSERDILAEAEALGHVGAWDWRISTGRLWWSDETYRILGLPPQGVTATYDAFLGRVHPDDRAELERRVAAAIDGIQPFDVEHRVVRPSGEVRFVREHGSVTRAPDGSMVRMLGFIQDVTKEHALREALAVSEERHRLLAENAWEVVWTMDLDGATTYVSPAVERVRGFTIEEAMAQSLDEIHPAESAARVIEYLDALRAAIQAGTEPPRFTGELNYLRKDGSIMGAEVQIVPHVSADGKVTQVLGVTRDVSERQQFEAELNRLAVTDPLTGVWNRRRAQELFTADLYDAQRYGVAMSALMLDIDHFKQINDTHGHHVGDLVLVELSRRLLDNLRTSDALVRWGGEEFVIVMRHCTLADAEPLAEKIRGLIADTPFPDVGTVTVSIGAAELVPGDDLASWLKRADAAMYAAKGAGRNAVRASA